MRPVPASLLAALLLAVAGCTAVTHQTPAGPAEGAPRVQEGLSGVLEIDPGAEAEVLTDDARDAGLDLLLLPLAQGGYRAVVARGGPIAEDRLTVPAELNLRRSEVDAFRRAFDSYYRGRYEDALSRLAGGVAGSGGQVFAAAALAGLGRHDEAENRLAGVLAGSPEPLLEASARLLLSETRLDRARFDASLAGEVLADLRRSAELSRPRHRLLWARAQMLLGRYGIEVDTSTDRLRRAGAALDSALAALLLPQDLAEAAINEELLGRAAELEANDSQDRDRLLELAASHYVTARGLWRQVGAEARAEAVSHRLRALLHRRQPG